jgi:hypothetical protein
MAIWRQSAAVVDGDLVLAPPGPSSLAYAGRCSDRGPVTGLRDRRRVGLVFQAWSRADGRCLVEHVAFAL